jgi:hypothetical protein
MGILLRNRLSNIIFLKTTCWSLSLSSHPLSRSLERGPCLHEYDRSLLGSNFSFSLITWWGIPLQTSLKRQNLLTSCSGSFLQWQFKWPICYGEEDLNVNRLQKADRNKLMTIVHMVLWTKYLFAPIIMY